jgi:hypothetical protein
MQVLVGRVFENAVFDGPAIATIWMPEMPASSVFAIEERTGAVFIGGESAHR